MQQFVKCGRGMVRTALVLSWWSLACWVLPLGIGVPSAAAGDDISDDLVVHTIEKATEQVEDERFASGMVTRVDTADLFSRGDDLSTALLGVSGVALRRSSTPGQSAYLSVRGGNARQLVVELDGLRLSPPGGPGFDFGRLATDGVASADVYRGSAASVYGGGAVTGAVRLNPQQAGDQGWRVVGRSRLGSFGTTGLSGAAEIGDDDAGIRLHSGWRQGAGDFTFVDGQGRQWRRRNNDYRRWSGGATAHLRHGEHRLRATGWLAAGQAGSPGPAEFQDAFAQARHDDSRGLATLRWDGAQLIERPGLLVDAYGTVGGQRQQMHYRNDRSFLGQDRFESESTMGTLSATAGAIALVGKSHLARLDLRGRAESFVGLRQGDAVNTAETTARRLTLSTSLADEWLLADERLSLIAALRMEASDDGQSSASVQPLLPAVGAIFRATPWLEFRANGARTFRRPDFDELYLETESVRGNPDLDPERAWTGDVGLRLGGGQWPRLEAAYFYSAIDATILFLPVSAYLFEAQNLYGATSDGVELTGRWRPWKRLALKAGYTYTRAFFDGQYQGRRPQLPGIPRHRLAASGALDISGMAFWEALDEALLRGGLHYRSPINLDNFGSLSNGPAWRLNLGLNAGFGGRFRGALQVQNVFDNRQAQDILQRPLPGRTLYLSLEMAMGEKL